MLNALDCVIRMQSGLSTAAKVNTGCRSWVSLKLSQTPVLC